MIGPIACNPWNHLRSAGGSSGGAAAAVAAGIVPLAHANDAEGSLRVPAAACGIVGLKPSRGLIPQGPDFDNLLMGLASELVVSRTVRDSAAMLEACAGASRGPTPRLRCRHQERYWQRWTDTFRRCASASSKRDQRLRR